MRTLKLSVIAAAVLLLGMQGASAQGFYVGAHGGVNWTLDGEFGGFSDLTYETGFAAGATIGYKWSMNLRTELEATYRENDFDEFVGTPVTGDVSSWAFMANVFYDFDMGSPVVPYLGGGIGAAVVTFDSAVKEDDTVVAFQLGAGIGYEFTPNLVGSLDFRFFGTDDPEVTSGVDFEYYNVALMAGLRVGF